MIKNLIALKLFTSEKDEVNVFHRSATTNVIMKDYFVSLWLLYNQISEWAAQMLQ